MKRLYHQLLHHWGEPADFITFDKGVARTRGPQDLVHVAVWHPDPECDITSFNTLGMSERLMPGARYRAELNLGLRGGVVPSSDDIRAMARFLANLAAYPFLNALALDWRERLADPGSIPCFPGFTQLLLAPSLDGKGLEWFDPPDDNVKLLRAIPIGPYENHLLKAHGWQAFLAYADERHLDLFSPSRPLPPLAV